MPAKSTPPAPEPDQATRVLLLDASLTMFARHGFESTTLAALASSVGVTTGAVYSSFESKQDLFVSTVLYVREVVEKAVMGGQPVDATPEERAGAYLRSIADLTVSRPDMMAFRVIVPLELARNEGLRAALDDELSSRVDLCERVMARRQDGRKAPLSDKGRDLARVILTSGEGITGLLQGDPGIAPMDPSAAAKFMVDLVGGRLLAT
jgi:AcrR family transcriptional regulator